MTSVPIGLRLIDGSAYFLCNSDAISVRTENISQREKSVKIWGKIDAKKISGILLNPCFYRVTREGLEPTANGLKELRVTRRLSATMQ